MPSKIIAPKRGEPFVGINGSPLPVPMAWIEQLSLLYNTDTASILTRLDELEPQFVKIDATDSPYSAANNDYVLVDMSAGDVSVTLPASGRLSVSRSGASNTLTLVGTVNGVTNPTIIADGDAPSMAYIDSEFRYV